MTADVTADMTADMTADTTADTTGYPTIGAMPDAVAGGVGKRGRAGRGGHPA